MKTPVVVACAILGGQMLSAQPYSATQETVEGVSVVRLTDRERDTRVSITPQVGNIAFEMAVGGQNILWFPYDSVAEFASKPRLCGNPFLWPWANRLDSDGYYANGKRYNLNTGLANFGRDGAKQPIHGLVQFTSLWEVVSLTADDSSASVTSRLEFSRHPDLAAQFPFLHTVEMTYLLSVGKLEVRTRIENLSAESMPVSLGYHPYFQVHDAARDDWTVSLPARELWKLSDKLIPIGESEDATARFPGLDKLDLKGVTLDHVFGDLIRGGEGLARFAVQGAKQRIEVLYGPKFDTAVVYAPPGDARSFVCFEPMAGITNAFNLSHEGKYSSLQTIPAGQSWEESFWIAPSGF